MVNEVNEKFINTVLKTIDSISKHSDLQQRMKEIMSEQNAFLNSELSDIFCALVRGNENRENLWGNAGHDAKYYQDDDAVRSEIFANLFSIYAMNDQEAVKYLREISSDMVKAFLDVTEGANNEK